MAYSYKGVPMLKNPFDLALYQLLVWELKPRTVIEIGTNAGGSALWFADLLRTYGIEGTVHSIDVQRPEQSFPGVRFYRGDGRRLGATLRPEMMAAFLRPILVIEDADHRPETTLAALRFFDPWLRPGEYVVVEDGNIDDLFDAAAAAPFDGGPLRAIAEFLADRGDDYEIDQRFCDYYGRNVTWNVNGYLKKLR
jgi:cephalosporin hydroxylase